MSEVSRADDSASANVDLASKKKARPEVQLYRPGMLKGGTDLTIEKCKSASHLSTTLNRPPKVPHSSTEARQKQRDGNEGDDGSEMRHGGGRNRGRGRNRRGHGNRNRKDNSSVERESVCSTDEVWSIAGDGTAPQRWSNRRKGSQGSSQSTVKRGSGGESAASSTHGSVSNIGDFREFTGPNSSSQRNFSNAKQFHSSSQSLFDRPPLAGEGGVGGPRSSQSPGWRSEQKPRGRQNPTSSNSARDTFPSRTAPGSSGPSNFYRNSTYSSYREAPRNARNSNNSTGARFGGRIDAFASATDVNNMVFENSDMYGFRKLRRNEAGYRHREEDVMSERGGGSVNASRFERFASLRGGVEGRRGGGGGGGMRYSQQRLRKPDFAAEKLSEAGADVNSSAKGAQLSSQQMSFQDLCASFDSVNVGSFDWSSEVEAEEKRKKENEEREIERRKHGDEGGEAPSGEAGRGGRRQRGGTFSGSNLATRMSNRTARQRRRNDSYTSQTSSVAESIEERSDDECESGERTPTGEQQANGAARRGSVDNRAPMGSYLDEDAPRSARGGRGRGLNESQRGRGRGGAQYRRASGSGGGERPKAGGETFPKARILQREKPSEMSADRDERRASASGTVPLTRAIASHTGSVPAGVPAANGAVARGGAPVMPFDTSVPPPNVRVPPPILAAPTPIRYVPPNYAVAPPPNVNSTTPSVGNGRSGGVRQQRASVEPTEWPIHQEISKCEGPHIQTFNNTISVLFDRIADSADIAAGEQLVAASGSLSQIYMSLMTRNIEYTYSMNLEQHLWKQCFYKPIEALRTASNATGDAARAFRNALAKLIQQGLDFYLRLINKYEVVFGFLVEDYVYWPSGMPADDFYSCASVGRPPREASDHSVKVALISTQRLAVAVGDLHRYSAMVSGVKDYSSAKIWYHKSAQIGPDSGRSYNQLALLAVYASKWIDVIFNYVRALSAKYPFDTAKQPLFTAFNDMHKKIAELEGELNERLGENCARRDAEVAAARADRPHEIWISADGHRLVCETDTLPEYRTAHAFDTESVVKLYRRAVAYVLHTAGLLITKIGMEQFESVSERAVLQLSALLRRSECPLSAVQLVQFSLLFVYAVHNLTTPTGADSDTFSVQQQKAVQMVLTLLGVLLTPIEDEVPNLEGILTFAVSLPSRVRRVLPAVFVLCEWLSTPSVNRLYNSMPMLEPLEMNLIRVNTWHTLAVVANALADAESHAKLSRNLPASRGHSDAVEVLLPECVFLASFTDVFPAIPKSLLMSRLAFTEQPPSATESAVQFALHARLSAVLSLAEFLDGSGLHCFSFDERLRRFVSTNTTSSSRSTSPTSNLQSSSSIPRRTSVPKDLSADNRLSGTDHEEELTEEQRKYKQVLKENQLKKELLERETNEPRVVIEVRPEYLVPDTNTFIDHLESIMRIVQSFKFTILVPTTVISELTGLCQPVQTKPRVGPSADENQENWVGQRAKLAIDYLHEAASQGTPHIKTVTSKGSRLPSLSFALENSSREYETVNDDLILSSCAALSAQLPLPPSGVNDASRLYRSVVLLTEDRALIIKAVCANIPCRTIPSFMQWAALV